MTTEIADRRFVIGIDLGTTNCAVSYVDLQGKGSAVKRIWIFKIPQMTGPGEVNRLPVLPSFLYIPGEFDISREAIVELWEGADSNFAGTFARDHGSRVPARLVASAKSWLCHAKVDRRIRGGDPVQEGFHGARRGQGRAQADQDPPGHQYHGPHQNGAYQAGSPRSQSRADSQLGTSKRHIEGEHGVEPPRGHSQRKDAEDGEHGGAQLPRA